MLLHIDNGAISWFSHTILNKIFTFICQMFGLLLYVSEYTGKGPSSSLSIPKVCMLGVPFPIIDVSTRCPSNFLCTKPCMHFNNIDWVSFACTLDTFQVHDRAQIFVSCLSDDDDGGGPRYVGSIERWSNRELRIPNIKCSYNTSLFVLVRIFLFHYEILSYI